MRVHNMLEVRLLHLEAKDHNIALQTAIRELEASREIVRLKTLEQQKQSERELALAQETQRSLLPRFLPTFKNFQLSAFNSPTRYVGGDFYEFLHLASGEWVGVLADVSGKGMPAALLSSMVLGALSMEFRAGTKPQEVLSRINRLLCEKSLEHQFVTLFLFVLSPDGNGQFISAGHNPAYLFRATTGKIEQLTSEAHFLGMFDGASYESRALHLDCGDVLVVYSDGVTEAENPQTEVFGEKRLRDIIKQWAPSGGKAIEEQLLEAVTEFTQGMPQMDDVTFMVVEKCQ
jgi:phosphoserine phosphatase RsbU/P